MAEITRDQLLTAIISGRGPAFLRGVDLSGLNLANAGWLCEADLRMANLAGANLTKANLRDAQMGKVNLQDANLTGAVLDGAQMKDAKLNTITGKMASFRGADLQGARLVSANLQKANFQGARLEGADMEGAGLEGACFTDAFLDSANLKMAKLQDASFEGASLAGTILDKGDRSGRPGPPAAPGFSGRIHHAQLGDMIQLASLSRGNILLRVIASQGEGSIYVRSGRVSHAHTSTQTGEAALFEILHWENGRFETLPLPEDIVVSIQKPLEHILVESMRRRDERRLVVPGQA